MASLIRVSQTGLKTRPYSFVPTEPTPAVLNQRAVLRLRAFGRLADVSQLSLMRLPFVLVCCALIAVACGSGDGTSGAKTSLPDSQTKVSGTAVATRPAATPGGAGSLIITEPDGLSEYDIKSGKSKALITTDNANTFLLYPAVSADYAMLTYVVQPPPKIDGSKYDAGSDLWIANRDGTGQRAVYTHDTPNQLVAFPQWEDAGHILAVVLEIGREGGTTSVVYTLERVDIATGARTKLLKDAIALGLSPDAKRAVYAGLAPQTGETLNVADLASGAPATVLVGLDQNLSPFNSPRFSPDGKQIAFASADQTGASAQFELVSAAGGVVDAPSRDGLPEDIWTVDAAGGTARRVADLKEDLPALTWSGDGKHLYVVGSAGLYDVNLQNGASTRLGDGSFHAQVVWVP